MQPPPIPRGIEVLVKKAAVDREFRELLLRTRADAAKAIGLTLEPAEATMLNSIPQAVLAQTIDRTTVKPEHRAVFLGKAAAAMLIAVGFAGLLPGCRDERPTEPPKTRGVDAERVEKLAPDDDPPAAPEEAQPPPDERPKEVQPTRGVRLERPEAVVPTLGVRVEKPQAAEPEEE